MSPLIVFVIIWSHVILVHNYGIRGNTLKWFQSYLTGRSQYVTYDGIESQVLHIKYGDLRCQF